MYELIILNKIENKENSDNTILHFNNDDKIVVKKPIAHLIKVDMLYNEVISVLEDFNIDYKESF